MFITASLDLVLWCNFVCETLILVVVCIAASGEQKAHRRFQSPSLGLSNFSDVLSSQHCCRHIHVYIYYIYVCHVCVCVCFCFFKQLLVPSRSLISLHVALRTRVGIRLSGRISPKKHAILRENSIVVMIHWAVRVRARRFITGVVCNCSYCWTLIINNYTYYIYM